MESSEENYLENDRDRTGGEGSRNDLRGEDSFGSGCKTDSYDECKDRHQRNVQVKGINILTRREVVLLTILANGYKAFPGLRHKGE